MSVRLVPAPISIVFSEATLDDERFVREYQSLSGADDDPIGQWLKLAKAKGDTQETDKVLLQLMIEMHRKIDQLEKIIKNEVPQRILLNHETMVEKIGFEVFELKEAMFVPGQIYYGRLNMPVYPQREVAVFFEALDGKQGKIVRIHERDQSEWNAYVTARERVMIREMKGRS
jgi:hypothetical protein